MRVNYIECVLVRVCVWGAGCWCVCVRDVVPCSFELADTRGVPGGLLGGPSRGGQ